MDCDNITRIKFLDGTLSAEDLENEYIFVVHTFESLILNLKNEQGDLIKQVFPSAKNIIDLKDLCLKLAQDSKSAYFYKVDKEMLSDIDTDELDPDGGDEDWFFEDAFSDERKEYIKGFDSFICISKTTEPIMIKITKLKYVPSFFLDFAAFDRYNPYSGFIFKDNKDIYVFGISSF